MLSATYQLAKPKDISVRRCVGGTLLLAGSKSIENRLWVIAALSSKATIIEASSQCDDAKSMRQAVRRLGCRVDVLGKDYRGRRYQVHGGHARWWREASLSVGDAGTAGRFLLGALASVEEGRYTMAVSEQLARRPWQDLLVALTGQGATIKREGRQFVILSSGLRGGSLSIAGHLSSQFISSLLLAAPYASSDVRLHLSEPVLSRPYIDMTISLMCLAGAKVLWTASDELKVCHRSRYTGGTYAIEADFSSASYPLVLAAIWGVSLSLEGVSKESIQGDFFIFSALTKMGCRFAWEENRVTMSSPKQLKSVDLDLSDHTDLAPAIAAASLFASGVSRLSGLAHSEHKECRRLSTLASLFTELGAELSKDSDSLTIKPLKHPRPAVLDPLGDHRMAMACACVASKVGGVRLLNPECVRKSYPHFWQDFAKLCP